MSAEEIVKAGIVLVGDYHALPNSQRYLASLLRDPELHQRPVVLGVETIFSRDQHILDEWFRGEIEEDELRQRIRFELDWGYDWPPFYELLSTARDHGAPIYGLDCMPREDLRKIGARDRHAADKIAELRRQHPDALIARACSASRTSHPSTCPPCSSSGFPRNPYSPFCKMSTPSTGAPPEKPATTSKPSKYAKKSAKTSAKMFSASSTPRHWKNTRTTASASTAGDETTMARPISVQLSTT